MENPQPTNQETPGQQQARLRRDRREAKLKAEGTSRLEKITKVSGRQNLPDLPPVQPVLSPSTSNLADPDEVDLSTHLSARATPNKNNGQPTGTDIRALLGAGGPQPGVNTEHQQSAEEDPMMKMFSQLLGGGAEGTEGTEGGGGGFPPGVAAMMGGMGGAGGMGQAQPEPGTTYDYVWKIVHAVFAFGLGVYVLATSTAFVGPVVRIPGKVVSGATEGGEGMNLFWAFATVELFLQSSRYFLERGKTGSGIGGWLGMASGLLGEPWGSYVRLVAGYSGIWTTIVEDGCVLIFVVGAFSWWKGAIG